MTKLFVASPDGTHIAYDVTGHGPALMLLHGAGKTRRDWRTAGYVERLKNDFSVITVDLRGTGDSDHPLGVADYAIDKLCADLNAVADACGAQQFSIWGYSLGGNIARYLGAWSDRVRAIAVIGVPLGHDPAFDQYLHQFVCKWKPAARPQGASTAAEKKKSRIKGQIPVWLACFQAMLDWPHIEAADIVCPTMLVVGTRNKSAIEWVKANRQSLDSANVNLQVVTGLNHNQEFSAIEHVLPLVRSYLKDRPLDGPE
jgi:pimeloyl-ACP methyl ester carboxylesterase